jgi:hypothetical protein
MLLLLRDLCKCSCLSVRLTRRLRRIREEEAASLRRPPQIWDGVPPPHSVRDPIANGSVQNSFALLIWAERRPGLAQAVMARYSNSVWSTMPFRDMA